VGQEGSGGHRAGETDHGIRKRVQSQQQQATFAQSTAQLSSRLWDAGTWTSIGKSRGTLVLDIGR
jgi:hypothetical protein